MPAIWYIRHGESVSNARGVFAGGQDNTPLTDIGKQQAILAGKKLHNFNIKFNHIICSPLSRARDTAQLIAQEIGFDERSIITDERLIEYDNGVGNGTPYENMNSAQLIAFDGAENPSAFEARVKAALHDIKKYKGGVLIVAHGGVGRLISCLQAGDDPANFYEYPKYPNAEAVKLDLEWLK